MGRKRLRFDDLPAVTRRLRRYFFFATFFLATFFLAAFFLVVLFFLAT